MILYVGLFQFLFYLFGFSSEMHSNGIILYNLALYLMKIKTPVETTIETPIKIT